MFLVLPVQSYSQSYPIFGNEIPVAINGLTFDAMEPFISPDGNMLLFNSLNDGINTSLYYATKINDSTFNFVGQVVGVNQSISPHLDAVSSLDSANNFFWVSTRDWPGITENLLRAGSNGASRVYGNFYIFSSGWIVMDAAINYDGNYLYYCNANFTGTSGGAPSEAKLGIAQKVNDSTFNKISNSDIILANINDTNYIVYAPQVTKDGLELYFTRVSKITPQTEICVSVRNSSTANFSNPIVIYSNQPLTPEAPTVTINKTIMYYHQKQGNIFKIFMRYRTGTTGIIEASRNDIISMFPNPSSGQVNITSSNNIDEVKITDLFGQIIYQTKTNEKNISLQLGKAGIYFVTLISGKQAATKKIIVYR